MVNYLLSTMKKKNSSQKKNSLEVRGLINSLNKDVSVIAHMLEHHYKQKTLAPIYRSRNYKIYLLRIKHGLPLKEISRTAGISNSNVYTLAQKWVRRLKSHSEENH